MKFYWMNNTSSDKDLKYFKVLLRISHMAHKCLFNDIKSLQHTL